MDDFIHPQCMEDFPLQFCLYSCDFKLSLNLSISSTFMSSNELLSDPAASLACVYIYV